ncbi:hypothetical protein BH582_21865 [Vibrio sp. 10N.222.47.A9]|uniref:DUF6622 family protein n=1 Tax=Vibrio sp. 10N.222.47.A9 TaxID=1903178 RepID=UPI00097686F2|nr:DUF6622 family protein [Vibrio sp. 10N.222.47.A9]OMO26522.1 hypothetical protein BH582_21865 [Vibrio sp. 10N.222.47.A9]
MFIEIVRNTPVWVWFLFAYLVRRGITSLRPREVSVGRLLIIPMLFFIWGIYGITTTVPLTSLTLTIVVASLVVGVLGLLLVNRVFISQAKYNPNTMMLTLPGQPISLLLILFAFISHYVFSAFIAVDPQIVSSASFITVFCVLSGVSIGSFWGNTLGNLNVVVKTRKSTTAV